MTVRFHRGDLPADYKPGPAIAVDTETLGLNPHRDRLCVVQVSTGDGTADVTRRFYRLFGDVNGDRKVNATDVARVAAGVGAPFNPSLDVNADGNVDAVDRTLVAGAVGRAVAARLVVDA